MTDKNIEILRFAQNDKVQYTKEGEILARGEAARQDLPKGKIIVIQSVT